MQKFYIEHIEEKMLKGPEGKMIKIKKRDIRCEYDTDNIKNNCCICDESLDPSERRYLTRGNYCPNCSAGANGYKTKEEILNETDEQD